MNLNPFAKSSLTIALFVSLWVFSFSPVIASDSPEMEGVLNRVALLADTIPASSAPVRPDLNEPIRVPEIMPEYPGCEDLEDKIARKQCADSKLLDHVYQNLQYPEEAREKEIQGTVIVSFVVEVDGSITGVKAKRDLGAGTGEEAVRIVNTFPKWHPGMHKGRIVRVLYNLPIKFRL